MSTSYRIRKLKELIIDCVTLTLLMTTAPLWILPMCWYLLGDVPEHKDGSTPLILMTGILSSVVMIPFYTLCLMEVL
jgi:hypothetical protein